MRGGVSEELLSQLSAFVADKMGLHFPRERRRDLERGVNALSRELGFEDSESYIDWLLSSSGTRSQIELLASHLTVGETYFFRDKKVFEALEELVLPKLIQSRRESGKHLRIWSAGCATGEEPYSIAILLSKVIPDLRNWNITILATDINPHFLRKAADGLYGNWSFRDPPPGIEEGFFKQTGAGRFEILSRIKELVTFSYLNLVEDTYPSLLNNTNAMDIIFCRNVLMYFLPERARKAIRNLHRSLVDGGCLVVSPSESSHLLFSQFATVRSAGAILYRKAVPSPPPAGTFFCKPHEKPARPSTPAVGLVPDHGATPVPVSANIRLTSQKKAPKAPLEARNPKPETRPRFDLYREALALYEEGCYGEAAEKTEGLVSQNASDAKGLSLLARIYANLGRLEKALEWCEKAIAAEKLNPVSYYLMATIFLELGRTKDAVLSLKRALYLDPNLILAHMALGNIARQRGKHKESVKHFENALLLLTTKRPEEILPESEGMNAGRLMEIVQGLKDSYTSEQSVA